MFHSKKLVFTPSTSQVLTRLSTESRRSLEARRSDLGCEGGSACALGAADARGLTSSCPRCLVVPEGRWKGLGSLAHVSSA